MADLPELAPQFPEMDDFKQTAQSAAGAAKDAVASVAGSAAASLSSATPAANTSTAAPAPAATRPGDTPAPAPVTPTPALGFLPQIKLPVAATRAPTTATDVFMWRNPYLTGIIFASVNVVFMLCLFGGYSLLRVFSSAALFYLLAGFVVVNTSKIFIGFTGKPLIPEPVLGQEYFRKDVCLRNMDKLVNGLNHAVDIARKAIYCVDNKQTLQLCGIMYALSLVGRLIPDMWLLYLAFLGSFTMPIVYEMYKEDIDKQLAKIKKIIEQYYQVGKEQVSKQSAEMQKVVGQKMEQLKTQVQQRSAPILEKSGVASKLGMGATTKKTE